MAALEAECERRDSIEPGETRPLYVQFQDPPQNVNEVDLQLGNMQVVSISLPVS
jgi:hypothetical protein